MTTLGWLKHMKDPKAPYFDWLYRKNLHKILTEKWWIMQSGVNDEALHLWLDVFKLLEFDKKARRDLLLLAQSGLVGRTHANKVLWYIMTGPALDPTSQDLSNLVTNMVYTARRDFDRPPREHEDLKWWWWTCYQFPYRRDLRWSPAELPKEAWQVNYGPGGKPLPPPECWGITRAR